MLYREIMAVCSEIHIKHINTLCGQNVEFFVKNVCKYRNHYCLSVHFSNTLYDCRAAGTPHTQDALPSNNAVAAHNQSYRYENLKTPFFPST